MGPKSFCIQGILSVFEISLGNIWIFTVNMVFIIFFMEHCPIISMVIPHKIEGITIDCVCQVREGTYKLQCILTRSEDVPLINVLHRLKSLRELFQDYNFVLVCFEHKVVKTFSWFWRSRTEASENACKNNNHTDYVLHKMWSFHTKNVVFLFLHKIHNRSIKSRHIIKKKDCPTKTVLLYKVLPHGYNNTCFSIKCKYLHTFL